MLGRWWAKRQAIKTVNTQIAEHEGKIWLADSKFDREITKSTGTPPENYARLLAARKENAAAVNKSLAEIEKLKARRSRLTTAADRTLVTRGRLLSRQDALLREAEATWETDSRNAVDAGAGAALESIGTKLVLAKAQIRAEKMRIRERYPVLPIGQSWRTRRRLLAENKVEAAKIRHNHAVRVMAAGQNLENRVDAHQDMSRGLTDLDTKRAGIKRQHPIVVWPWRK
jgi:hypothetical protein